MNCAGCTGTVLRVLGESMGQGGSVPALFVWPFKQVFSVQCPMIIHGLPKVDIYPAPVDCAGDDES